MCALTIADLKGEINYQSGISKGDSYIFVTARIIYCKTRAEMASIYSKCHLIVLIYDTFCLVNLKISFQGKLYLQFGALTGLSCEQSWKLVQKGNI